MNQVNTYMIFSKFKSFGENICSGRIIISKSLQNKAVF